MIPEQGQHVKCLLRNGNSIEGIVDSWSDQQSIIKDLDGKSLTIIQRTSDDILLIRIMLEVPISAKIQSEIRKEIAVKLKEAADMPSNDELRLKTIAELKILSDKQERDIIAKKLKDHQISEVRKTKYEYPGFFQKQGTK
jgi:hypothetical protein